MRHAILLVLLASAAPARADNVVQKAGPEIFPSRHEWQAALGYQAGFGGSLGSPSGIKLTLDYNYRFHPFVWFDLQLGNVFGFGPNGGACAGDPTQSCYRGGWDLSLSGGVRLKFAAKSIPLVGEVPILVGLDANYARECGDDAVTIPVARAGGALKYFITKKLGVGIGANLAFGPSFHRHGSNVCSQGAYSDFYGAFDFHVAAELVL